MSLRRTPRPEAVGARWALVCLSLALGLTSACGPRRARWRPTPTPVGPTGGSLHGPAGQLTEAVVWSGARFLVSPREGATAISLAPAASALEPWLRDTFLSVRVVEQRGDFITIETAGDPARCSARRQAAAPGALQLRLHVPAGALAQVTTREITQRFEDGTELTLRRGVPVEQLGRDLLYRVQPGSVSFVVRLNPSDVGTRFLPSEEPEPIGLSRGSLSAEHLRAGTPSLGGTGAVHSTAGTAIAVWAAEPRAASSLVQLRPACAELTVLVPQDAVGPPIEMSPPEPSPPPRAPYALADTTATWRGGAPAGVVVSPLNLGEERAEDGGARCFLHRLSESATPLELCFPRARIVDAHPRGRALSAP